MNSPLQPNSPTSIGATKARLREAQAVVMQQAVDKDLAAWGKMLGV